MLLVLLAFFSAVKPANVQTIRHLRAQYSYVPQVFGRPSYGNAPQVFGMPPTSSNRIASQIIPSRRVQYWNAPQVFGRPSYGNAPQVFGMPPISSNRIASQIIPSRRIQYGNAPQVFKRPTIALYRTASPSVGMRPVTQYNPQVYKRPQISLHRIASPSIRRRPQIRYRNSQVIQSRPFQHGNAPQVIGRLPRTEYKNVPQVSRRGPVTQYRKPQVVGRPLMTNSNVPRVFKRPQITLHRTASPSIRRHPVIQHRNPQAIQSRSIQYGNVPQVIKRPAVTQYKNVPQIFRRPPKTQYKNPKVVYVDKIRKNQRNKEGRQYKMQPLKITWELKQNAKKESTTSTKRAREQPSTRRQSKTSTRKARSRTSTRNTVATPHTPVISNASGNGKVVYDVWLVFERREYMVKRNAKSFDDAKSSCEKLDAHLVSIHSQEENNFIHKITSTGSKIKSFDEFVYIGLRLNSKNKWEWLDGNGLNYENWAEHQPDQPHIEKCAQFHQGPANLTHVQDYKWNSISCNSPMKYYVCKKNQQQKSKTSFTRKAGSPNSVRNSVTTLRTPVISNASGNGKVVYDVWLVFEKREYMVKRNAKSFDDAEMSCKKLGAHLASIHSEEENNFIHKITSTGSKIKSFDEFVYIGLRLNSKNEWEWLDGSGLNYKNWAEHQPDQPHIEKCAQFHQGPANLAHVQDYKWNSISCNLPMKYYVCKKNQQQK
ncbi:unnamed protein product [Cylicocyclus nassatus]|uniref:C-type lectin domain-containing protein n=1 Tax=Cylicocyclus nassatus TaxID=53992 RepID=A0AA36H038_CYLNA|nr:unnamed protein product [Cylicocyclus nassatus]